MHHEVSWEVHVANETKAFWFSMQLATHACHSAGGLLPIFSILAWIALFFLSMFLHVSRCSPSLR